MNNTNIKNVILGGGCFWCVESDLRHLNGVLDAVSGYTGDSGNEPTYENHKGFVEAVLVSYDPTLTSFQKVCEFFLDHIDPMDGGGQFFDRGELYKTAIFYKTEEEMKIAHALIKELEESGLFDSPIRVQVLPEKPFFKAEEYHQRYSEKNPAHYSAYKQGSGRADFVARTCMIRDEKKIHWKEKLDI